MRNVDNTQDTIYSLDVIARIEQLQAIRTAGPVAEDILEPEDYSTDQDSLFAELAALESLAEEASDSPDWEYGESLIRDSYFQEYAQDLAEEIGAIGPNASWPLNCIDWEHAARELRYDYTCVTFDGVTYWIR